MADPREVPGGRGPPLSKDLDDRPRSLCLSQGQDLALYLMRLFHEQSSLVGKYRTVQQQITYELHIFSVIVIWPRKAILCIAGSIKEPK